jgi:hypothetical protein
MQSNTGMRYNRTTIDKGEYFTLVKSQKMLNGDGELSNRRQYLIQWTTGPNAGDKVWTENLPIKKKLPFDPYRFFEVCLSDYVNAGWKEADINKAFLCPKEYKCYLSQWIRNRERLHKAEAI